MAKIFSGMGTSHIPAVGTAIDHGKEDQEYWQDYFKGLVPARTWHADNKPDVVIIVYNDHASAFSLEQISTFTIGVSDKFIPADEGYGPRKVPIVQGHSTLAWHLVESLVLDEFDMAISNNMPVDHGLTVPLSIAYDAPDAWPVKVVPLCVNVIQYPQPTAKRCYDLGGAIRKAVESFDEDINVSVWGTGGLSHQLQGERAGVINKAFDTAFMDNLVNDPIANTKFTHTDFIREAGSEGIEMIMWNIMRGAMASKVKELYRFYHIPVSNTAYGLQILKDSE